MQHIKNFLKFTKTFGIYSNWHVFILVAGGVSMSALEILGLAALFPLLNLIMIPDQIDQNAFIQRISKTFDIHGHGELTMVVGLMIAGIFVFKNVLQIIYLKYEFNTLTQWRIHIVSNLYRIYMNADYELFMNRNSVQMINVITGTIRNIINNYVHKVITLLNNLLTGAVILFFVISVNWVLATLVFLAGFLVVRVYSKVFKKASRKLGQESEKLMESQYSLLQQSFSGYKETKSHLKEDYFSKKFLANSEKLAKTDGRLFFIENLPPSTVEIVIMVLLIASFEAIVFTGNDIGLAAAQAGTIVLACLRLIPVINRTIASIVMINTTVQPVDDLMNEIKLFGIEPADFSKLGKEAAENDDSQLLSISFKEHISLNNLSYQYAGTDKLALNNIDFSIKPGEFIGITGPSGGGKSTLINILLGFLTNFSGKFTVDGIAINKSNIKSLRKIVGFVDQQTFILDDTIARNVAYGVDLDHIDRARVQRSLEKAQLWDYVSSLPDTIDTSVGENGKLLSGGQRQRIAIARAFYRDLKLLILDEASASLDVETEHKFFSYLKTLKGELSVIMIAHRLSTLKDCGKIVFIDQGKSVAEGTFDELYHTNETFKNYIQFSQIHITKQE